VTNGHKVYKENVRSQEQGVRSHAFGGVRIGPKALEVGGAALPSRQAIKRRALKLTFYLIHLVNNP